MKKVLSIIMILIALLGSPIYASSRITIPKPQIMNLAEHRTDISGIKPKSDMKTKSNPLLAGDINTVTYLDTSNVLGSPGFEHWDIISPGTYILTYTPPSGVDINTNHDYAVWIMSSDVIFDGNGKTITGPGIGTTLQIGPSWYGVRVNSGTQTLNVTVKNVTVSNKQYGISYEYVQGGEIRDSNITSNDYGIYTWKSAYLNILSNTVHLNNKDGITLDADQSTNDHFTIESNNVYTNGNNGITLWLSNNHNTINNNQVNGNNVGIALTDGQSGESGTINIISNNTIGGNVNGIMLSNYSSNNVSGNSLSGNSNAAVLIEYASNSNTISNNQVNDNTGMGIVLTDEGSGLGGNGNTLSYNTINRNFNGIVLRNYHGNSIINNSLSDNTNVGIWLLYSSSGNQFTGNSVVSSETTGWYGVYLSESVNNNIFYNNLFKNSHPLNPDENYGSDGSISNNQWYTIPTPGVNIVGGPTIGGNYWGNASSTGFSDTQPDSNNDGFCDQPYNPVNYSSELIDQYPLHKMAVFNVTPTSLNFGYVPVGSTKDLTLTVKNTGAGTLTGNATTATPFSIFSGGSYSLGPDQIQVVTVRYQPVAAGPHAGAVLFTGGGGSTVPVTGKTEKPRGLPWEILLLGN